MVLFFFSCIFFLFSLANMYRQPEMTEMELADEAASAMIVLTIGVAVWSLCVAFAVETLSAFLLCAVLLLGIVCSFFIDIDPGEWLGKALGTMLEVAVPALAFIYMVSYLYPRA